MQKRFGLSFFGGLLTSAALAAATVEKPVLSGGERLVVPGTWCSLGTSISWYNDNVSASGGRFTKGYQTRVLEQVCFDALVNRGVNGGCVSSAIGQAVKADFYTIEHGVNDWGNRVSPETFEANYRKVLADIRQANPQAKIVLCTPRKGYGFGTYLPDHCDKQQPNGYFLKDYVAVVRKLADEEKLPVADFYATCGEQGELADLSIDVALHPNDAGYQRMANELVKAIAKVYPDARRVKDVKPAFTDDGTPRIVRFGDKFLGAQPTLVLKGVPLDCVSVEGADMGGTWVPGGPFPCRAECVAHDRERGTLTCQLQCRSPKDNVMRIILLELEQTFRGDVTARLLRAHYRYGGGEYGVDYDQESNRSGSCGLARNYGDQGYVIGRLILGLNGAKAQPEVELPLEPDLKGAWKAAAVETVPFAPESPVVLVPNAKLADVVGFSAEVGVAFGVYDFKFQTVDRYYAEPPTDDQEDLAHNGFYHFKRTSSGDECWARVEVQVKAPGHGGKLLGVIVLDLVQVGGDIRGAVSSVHYPFGSNYGMTVSGRESSAQARYFGPGDDLTKNHNVLNLSLRHLQLRLAGKRPRLTRTAAPRELLDGVRSIDVGGGAVAGPFVLLTTNAFPLAVARTSSDATAFVAVGATYGKGKAVALGHPDFFRGSTALGDTWRLVANAVRWMSRGAKPRLAVLRDQGRVVFFRELGFDDVRAVEGTTDLKGVDVLVTSGCRAEETKDVLAFVSRGGGLLATSLGWGYLYFNPTADFAEAFADNSVFGPLGFLQGKTMVSRVRDGFPVATDEEPRGTRVDEAFRLALSETWPSMDASVRRQVAATLGLMMPALAHERLKKLQPKFEKIFARPEARRMPSLDKPLTEKDAFARLYVLLKQQLWLAKPERPIAADPAAAVYPGLVKPGTPTVEKRVMVDLAIPRWQSTGVFAPAGKPLTVKIDPAAAKFGLKVRIGTTADDVTGLPEWKRAPRVTMEHPLTKPETTVYSPFGGLVYIVVPSNQQPATSNQQPVLLSGGVMAPWFKLGRDTAESFKAACAASGAPYGEIEGKNLIITAETAGLARVKDPAWIARYWDKVVAEDRALASLTARKSPERICSDVQLTGGFMHAGYPLMTHVNRPNLDWAIDEAMLAKGDAWGCFHEVGHNHQDRAWTPRCCGEVTVNLFTVLAIEKVAGQDWREERFPSGRNKLAKKVSDWVAHGKRFDNWKGDPFLALELYLRLQEAYGWEAYTRTFARYRSPGFKGPNRADDTDIFNVFIRSMSETVNANLAPVFAAWSVPVTDETRTFCSKYPAAESGLTAGL